jgi:hypothetical protein
MRSLLLCSLLPLSDALSVATTVRRIHPPRMQLLGPDGLPIGGGGGASSSPGGLVGAGGQPVGAPGMMNVEGDSEGAFVMPDDLADFDPTYDPLAAPRPKYDLAAASGRHDETVWGAVAPASAAEIGEWVAHVKGVTGAERTIGLFSEAEAAARSHDGTATGYMAALVAAGFDGAFVSLLDPRQPGSRDVVLAQVRGAGARRERILVHCADGVSLTGVVLADWLLTDYIGGEHRTTTTTTATLASTLAANRRAPATRRLARPPQSALRGMSTERMRRPAFHAFPMPSPRPRARKPERDAGVHTCRRELPRSL